MALHKQDHTTFITETIMKGSLFLLPFMTACIIIDDGGEKDYNWDDWDTGWEASTEDTEIDNSSDSTEPKETAEPLEDHNGSFFLIPNAAPPGETFVSNLRSVDNINWGSIQEIIAFGDIEICSTQTLFDEMLLTIKIPSDAQESPVDIIVEYTDGDIDLIENAIYIDQEAAVGTAATDPSACD